MDISNSALERMDKEFKIAGFLLIFLLAASALLLVTFAKIHIFSRSFIGGFVPFSLLLAPCILFSSRSFLTMVQGWIRPHFAFKLIFPSLILLIYSIFGLVWSNFSWMLFLKLSGWLFLPTLIFLFPLLWRGREWIADVLAALLLWLPIEFGWLSGFDLVFGKDITIPALPFAAVASGLYLFAVVRKLDGIGFTFSFKIRDFEIASFNILILALLLIPLGTQLGFIGFSSIQVSFAETIKLVIGIYFMVALPEELLFRGIIQNLLSRFFLGARGWILSLSAASIIFGLSHWNNFYPPDWRYVFLASIAGAVYGITYLRTGKTTASALVHCGVNFFWAVFFPETRG